MSTYRQGEVKEMPWIPLILPKESSWKNNPKKIRCLKCGTVSTKGDWWRADKGVMKVSPQCPHCRAMIRDYGFFRSGSQKLQFEIVKEEE